MPPAPRNPSSRPSRPQGGSSAKGRPGARGQGGGSGRPGSSRSGDARNGAKGGAPRGGNSGGSRSGSGARSGGTSSGSSYPKTRRSEDFGDRPAEARSPRPSRQGGPRAGAKPGERSARTGGPSRSGDRPTRPGERTARTGGPSRSGDRPTRPGERTARTGGPSRSGDRPIRPGERSTRPSGPPRAGGRSGDARSRDARGSRNERAGGRDFEANPRTARERGDMPKSWGSVARRGASTINRDTAPVTEPKFSRKPPAPQDEWILIEDDDAGVEEVVVEPRKVVITLPGDVSAAIRRAAVAMTTYQREKRVEQMQKAVDAYDRNRYEEAARLANRLAQDLPDVTAIREIAGLSSYRSGQWRIARMHLERYRELSTEPEYLPLEMDAARAMGRVRVVTDLFEILRQESPDPELLAEARLVVAGSLADRGKLKEAIELLESNGAGEPRRKPAERHVRQWYALADLFDRAGELPKARRFFEMVDAADPDAYGVRSRLKELGVAARKRTPRPRQKSVKKA